MSGETFLKLGFLPTTGIIECGMGDMLSRKGGRGALNLARITHVFEVNTEHLAWKDACCWVQFDRAGCYVDLSFEDLLEKWRHWEQSR